MVQTKQCGTCKYATLDEQSIVKTEFHGATYNGIIHLKCTYSFKEIDLPFFAQIHTRGLNTSGFVVADEGAECKCYKPYEVPTEEVNAQTV